MRKIRFLASLLRVTGVVILCFALIISLYSVSTSAKDWGTLDTYLKQHQVNTGLFDRIRFDQSYFGAMVDVAERWDTSEAANSKAKVLGHLSYLSARVEDQRLLNSAAAMEAVLTEYDQEGKLAAVLENCEAALEKTTEREQKKINDEINNLSKPAKGKGISIDYSADCEAKYQALVAEHGEEATGTEIEYSRVILQMYKDYKAGKGALTIKDYLDKELNWEAYQQQLALVQAVEDEADDDNLVAAYVQLLRDKQAGKEVDFAAFYTEAYDQMKAYAPDMTMPSLARFTVCLNQLLTDPKSGFLGTEDELRQALVSEEQAYRAGNFAAFADQFAEQVIKTADERKEVRIRTKNAETGIYTTVINIPAILWHLARLTVLFWVVGVALVILSIVISIILNRSILKRCRAKNMETVDENDDVLLRVEHVKQYFRSKGYVNKAVDDVSFEIKKGEVFGLVGESGCGKTTTGRTIINLYDPTDGDIYFKGQRISTTEKGLPTLLQQLKNDYKATVRQEKHKTDVQISANPENKAQLKAELKEKLKTLKAKYDQDTDEAYIHTMESRIEKKNSSIVYREQTSARLLEECKKDIAAMTDPEEIKARKRTFERQVSHLNRETMMTKMQMIFQDPIASINPRMTVREIIAEGLQIRGIRDKKYIDKKVVEILELVGLVAEHADRYPHEFSGGQRQRIGIARAVIMEPELIIADEPISALDVSIQAQVLNLLNELRETMGLTILFIAHNLSVVKFFSDRIAVMYFGKIVEMTTSDELFAHPLHPYTKSLLSAIPYPDPEYEKNRKRITYNPAVEHDYSKVKPSMKEIVPGHFIYCNDAELEKYKQEMGL